METPIYRRMKFQYAALIVVVFVGMQMAGLVTFSKEEIMEFFNLLIGALIGGHVITDVGSQIAAAFGQRFSKLSAPPAAQPPVPSPGRAASEQ